MAEGKIDANKIAMPWEQHESHDVEIGWGVDFDRGRVGMVFDRYVQTVWFEESNLREFIRVAELQLEALRKGKPLPG